MKLTKAQCEAFGIPLPGKPRKKSAGELAIQQTTAEKAFDALCVAHGLPIPVHEFEFAAEIGRNWRFDYVWDWLALEVQGGNWIQGRHTRAGALEDEYAKLNAAVRLGYAVLFCTPKQVEDGSIFPVIKEALGREAEQP